MRSTNRVKLNSGQSQSYKSQNNIMKHLYILSLTVLTFALAEEPFCSNTCQKSYTASHTECYCDEQCSIFDDCCADSKQIEGKYELPSILSKQKHVLCKSVGPKQNVYVIDSCSKDWNGPDFIRNHCTHFEETTKDPVGEVLATNYETGITYSSYFCAVCNGDAEKLLLWQIQIDCPFHPNVLLDRNEAMQYIFYNEAVGQWGYLIRGDFSGDASFYGCNITSLVPKSIAEQVRVCHPDTVRECSSTWKNDIIRRMCSIYEDPVYANGTRYRNFYCAVCNKVDQSQMTCGTAIGPRHNVAPDSRPIERASFVLLLDFNLKDGNNVGKKSCTKGEVFDPFARRCRNIVCGVPGFVVKYGKCVLELSQAT